MKTFSYVKRMEVDRGKILVDQLYAQINRTRIDGLPKEIREQDGAAASFGRETNKSVAAGGQARLPGNFLFSVRSSPGFSIG